MTKSFCCALFFGALVSFGLLSCSKENLSRTEMLTGFWHADFEADDLNGNRLLDESEKVPVTHPDSTYEYIYYSDGGIQKSGGNLTKPVFYFWDWLENESRIRRYNYLEGADTSAVYFISDTRLILEQDRSGVKHWSAIKN